MERGRAHRLGVVLTLPERRSSDTFWRACFSKSSLARLKLRYRKPSGRVRAVTYFVLYLALITIAPLPDRLILFPTTSRIDAGAAVRKPIPFEGGELEIWTAQSRLAKQRGQPEIYVLRFYGNADRADRWVADEAEMWNNRAVEVWGMNYPGFGGSTGRPGSRSWDQRACHLRRPQTNRGERPIVIFGASPGTTTRCISPRNERPRA